MRCSYISVSLIWFSYCLTPTRRFDWQWSHCWKYDASFYWATFGHLQLLHSVCLCATFFSPPSSEKEAEKIKERLAQEEAEAMEMEDEENKAENANNDKEVCEESSYQAEHRKTIGVTN